MTYKEIVECQEKEKAFLDTLDLTKYLINDKPIYDIMDEIYNDHNEEYQEEDDIFNCMDQYDFMDYLMIRYKSLYFYEYSEMRVRSQPES